MLPQSSERGWAMGLVRRDGWCGRGRWGGRQRRSSDASSGEADASIYLDGKPSILCVCVSGGGQGGRGLLRDFFQVYRLSFMLLRTGCVSKIQNTGFCFCMYFRTLQIYSSSRRRKKELATPLVKDWNIGPYSLTARDGVRDLSEWSNHSKFYWCLPRDHEIGWDSDIWN